MAPTIFLVPGLWEGPTVYEPLTAILQMAGFKTFVTYLKSTGTRAPNNPTMKDDVAHIKADLEAAVDAAGSEGVLYVLHSAGGFIGSFAMEGLAESSRKKDGKVGGVKRIVLLAAGLAPEGADDFKGPFIVDQDDGGCVCVDSMGSLFHDMPREEAEKWQARMDVQPLMEQWGVPITYCGWRDAPSTYVLCEEDRLIPVPLQEQIAGMAGSDGIVRIKAGHMAHLSKTEEVAEIIGGVAKAL